MHAFLVNFTYFGLVVALLGTGMGLPIPEDVTLLAAGYLCGQGVIRLHVAIPLAVAAVLASDGVLYYLGRRHGRHLDKLPLHRLGVRQDRLDRAMHALQRHGGKTLFLARFLPGVRAAVYVAAGVCRVPFWKLIVFDGAAAMMTVPALLLLGWWFAGSHDAVQHHVRLVQVTLIVAVIAALSGYVAYRRFSSGHERRAAGAET